MEEKEVTTGEILAAMNRGFTAMTERFDSKIDGVAKDLQVFKFETTQSFNTLESELKSFKLETEDNFSEVKEKLDDLYDTDRGFDKRLEHLEEKAAA